LGQSVLYKLADLSCCLTDALHVFWVVIQHLIALNVERCFGAWLAHQNGNMFVQGMPNAELIKDICVQSRGVDNGYVCLINMLEHLAVDGACFADLITAHAL